MGDEEQTKFCTNCQRDIPAANFTIHSVHCTRHITVCPKCKEPIPVTDMKMHLAHVPCGQCGERMQSCDVAAHQSEACAQTRVQCVHCTLLLDRALMAEHELYCGARTQRCDDCGELVMLKYRKLHEETNHGFLKLDDEPGPQPSWTAPPRPIASNPKSSQPVKPFSGDRGGQQRRCTSGQAERDAGAAPSFPSAHLPAKRTNDMPQVNSAVEESGRHKELEKQPPTRPSTSKGAIKKYQAPQPPNGGKKSKEPKSKTECSLPFSHVRNVPLYSALLREQNQGKQREEQTAYNLEHGLPPVLNPLQKLDKLRKMSALQNADYEMEKKKKNKPKNSINIEENPAEFAFTPMSPEEMNKRLQGRKNDLFDQRNGAAESPTRNGAEHHYESIDYSPWSGNRVADDANSRPQPVDRFMEIKNDLRSLRKELKECSSPLEVRKSPNKGPTQEGTLQDPNRGSGTRGDNLQLNLPARNLANTPREQQTRNKQWNLPRNPAPIPNSGGGRMAANFVMLPCEFCNIMVPSEQLVDHELGCHNHTELPPPANNAFFNHFLDNPDSPGAAGSPDSPKIENARAKIVQPAPAPRDGNHRQDKNRHNKPKQNNHRNSRNNLPSRNSENRVATVDNDWDERTENTRPNQPRSGRNDPPFKNQFIENDFVNLENAMPANNPVPVNDWGFNPRRDNAPVNHPRPENVRANNPRLDNPQADVQPIEEKLDNAWVNFVQPDNRDRSPIAFYDLSMGNAELNDVMIPCEFCNSMISAADFVTHETGCNSLATSILPPRKDNQQNRNIDNAAPPNTPDGHNAPRIKNVNRPQRPALRNRDLNQPAADRRQPDVARLYANEDRELLELANNPDRVLPGLVNNPDRALSGLVNNPDRALSGLVNNPDRELLRENNQDSSPEEAVGPNFDEVKLPCEFCMCLIPATNLMIHQEICYAD